MGVRGVLPLTSIFYTSKEVANRQRSIDRFRADALRPLPVIPYDYRDTAQALVHKDLRLQFDGNRYCVPHRFVGRRLTVKADSSSVTIYHRYQEIVSYARSWPRGQEDFARIVLTGGSSHKVQRYIPS
jgi:hypothetical protein